MNPKRDFICAFDDNVGLRVVEVFVVLGLGGVYAHVCENYSINGTSD